MQCAVLVYSQQLTYVGIIHCMEPKNNKVKQKKNYKKENGHAQK